MAKHVTAGEKFRFGARTYNELNSLIEKDRESDLSMRTKANRSNNDFVLVKNISGTDVGRFGVLGIAGILFDPQTSLPAFTSRTVFTGQIPAESHKEGRFLICAEPIRNGAIGRAWADGIVTARIDVQDESHNYATVKPDDPTQLISADQGPCCILYKETGTGTKWGVSRIGGGNGASSSVIVCTITAIGSVLTCTVLYGGEGTAEVKPYPQIGTSHYRVGDTIVAVRDTDDSWMSLYHQPTYFRETV